MEGMEFWRNKDQQLKLLPKSKLFTGIGKFSNRKYELVQQNIEEKLTGPNFFSSMISWAFVSIYEALRVS